MVERKKRRIIFMGTSAFSEIILNSLLNYESGEIVGVFAQPDKVAGRGLKMSSNEVKKLALAHDLPLAQPPSLRTPEAERLIADMRPDFIISAAYGLILPENILKIPAIAPINVHASLLPAYRGAAPIQRAIMDNWQQGGKTGVTIMVMAPRMDAGPVYAEKEVAIEDMAYPALRDALAKAGAMLLARTLDDILYAGLQPVEQDEAKATYAPKLCKSDGRIDWTWPALKIDALIRATTPWPGGQAVFVLDGHEKHMPVTILPGKCENEAADAKPGLIFRDKKGLKIACADSWYRLEKLRPEGRREMTSADFANGQCRIKNGFCGHCASFEQ